MTLDLGGANQRHSKSTCFQAVNTHVFDLLRLRSPSNPRYGFYPSINLISSQDLHTLHQNLWTLIRCMNIDYIPTCLLYVYAYCTLLGSDHRL